MRGLRSFAAVWIAATCVAAQAGYFQSATTWTPYTIASTGEIQRGQYAGNLRGPADVLFASGGRFVGQYGAAEQTGLEVSRQGWVDDGVYDPATSRFQGTRAYPDGTRFVGRMDKGVRAEGKLYRADGTLAEEGRYEAGKLAVGKRHEPGGEVVAIDLPAERRAAAEKQRQEAEAAALRQRQEAEALAQRQREEAARAEQQFRASLQTMNPGQLFAKADELQAQGDRARAREVQRTLMSRFPDHPLAATAARQMAGESAAAQPAAAAAPAPGGGRLSAQQCSAMKQAVMATQVPSNASVTARTADASARRTDVLADSSEEATCRRCARASSRNG